jgi:hypothetical protein
MTSFGKQSSRAVASEAGLLTMEQFQQGYVTNDLDRACAFMGQRYGLNDFALLEGATPAGAEMRVAFAWGGNTLYELIRAEGPQTGFYNDCLPAEEFSVRFHHIGFLVQDPVIWASLAEAIEAGGFQVPFATHDTGFIDAFYVQAPELGHYLEYIHAEQSGLDFFEGLPRH